MVVIIYLFIAFSWINAIDKGVSVIAVTTNKITLLVKFFGPNWYHMEYNKQINCMPSVDLF